MAGRGHREKACNPLSSTWWWGYQSSVAWAAVFPKLRWVSSALFFSIWSCHGLQDLSSRPEMEPVSLQWWCRNLKHWTTGNSPLALTYLRSEKGGQESGWAALSLAHGSIVQNGKALPMSVSATWHCLMYCLQGVLWPCPGRGPHSNHRGSFVATRKYCPWR